MKKFTRYVTSILVTSLWSNIVWAGCPCMNVVYYRINYIDHQQQPRSGVVVPTSAMLSNTDYFLSRVFDDSEPQQLLLTEKFELALIQQEPDSKGWPVIYDTYLLQPDAIDSNSLPDPISQPIVFTTPTTTYLNYQEVYRIQEVKELFDLNCWPEVQVSIDEMTTIRTTRAKFIWTAKGTANSRGQRIPIYQGTLEFPGLSRLIPVSFSESPGGVGC